jgi:hypothetical protein
MKPDLIEELAMKWSFCRGEHTAITNALTEYASRAKADAPEAKPVAWAHYDCGELMGVLEFETERYNVPLYSHSGVTVPREPTEAMRKAMLKADDDYSNNRFYGRGDLSRMEFIYRAMLAAAEGK